MKRNQTIGCRISKRQMEEIETLISEHPYLFNKTQFLQIAINETIKNGTLKQYLKKEKQDGGTLSCKISIQDEEEIEQYLFDHPLLESTSQFLKGAIDEFLRNERIILEQGDL